MTHLNIQQGQNISELVNANIIKKLYEAALSVPEPLEGEQDDAYMSGRLEVPKSYRSQVQYLAGNINGEPNASGRFPDLRIDVTNSYYIAFEDPELASVLLSTVSTDGIGVSEGDASLVTSFSTLGLTNHSSITSFDELKYFTNITSIPQGALDGTDNITKINLKNISTLGQSSIGNKTQLSNVGQTTNLRTIGKFAFMNDSSLHNIDLTGVTTIEQEAFRGTGITDVNCPNLQNLNGSGNFQMSSVQTITDLGSVTILPDSAFWKCTSLTSADISNIVTIKNGVFNGCSSLNSINLSNVTSIGQNGFRECTHLTGALNLPNLTSLGQYAFYQTGISVLDLGPNLSSIGTQAFWGSTFSTFIFRGTTVPLFSTTNSDKFLSDMSNVTIYVPESALNDYKTAWPAMASNIVKIEGSIYDTQS